MAAVTVKKTEPRPFSVWDDIEKITLELDIEEAKALVAVCGKIGGGTVGKMATSRIYYALTNQIGTAHDQSFSHTGSIGFTR